MSPLFFLMNAMIPKQQWCAGTDTQGYDIVDHIHHIAFSGIGKCPAIGVPSTVLIKSTIDHHATIGTVTVINQILVMNLDNGSSVNRFTMTQDSCVVAQGNCDDGDIQPDAVLMACAGHSNTITSAPQGSHHAYTTQLGQRPTMIDTTYPTIGTLPYDNGALKEHDLKKSAFIRPLVQTMTIYRNDRPRSGAMCHHSHGLP